MWQPIKISEQNYFFQCSVDESCIRFYLYNLREVWSEQCSIDEVTQRAKELNKRILYNNETVLNTIKTAKPTTSALNSTEDGLDLVLKYHVVGRPLNFEWKLKLLAADDIQKLVTYPLFMSIYYLSEQIKELKTIIKKKDVEIGQYKAQGAILGRKTVETPEFSEEAFNKCYSEVQKISDGFLNISDNVKAHFPKVEIITEAMNKVSKPNGSSTFVPNDNIRRSPNKAKRRKFFERNRIHMEKLIKAKKEMMEYQSSQSQSPPREELAEILQSLDELDAKRLASTTL